MNITIPVHSDYYVTCELDPSESIHTGPATVTWQVSTQITSIHPQVYIVVIVQDESQDGSDNGGDRYFARASDGRLRIHFKKPGIHRVIVIALEDETFRHDLIAFDQATAHYKFHIELVEAFEEAGVHEAGPYLRRLVPNACAVATRTINVLN